MNEDDVRRFLWDLISITEAPTLISERIEVSSEEDMSEIRRFLGEII